MPRNWSLLTIAVTVVTAVILAVTAADTRLSVGYEDLIINGFVGLSDDSPEVSICSDRPVQRNLGYDNLKVIAKDSRGRIIAESLVNAGGMFFLSIPIQVTSESSVMRYSRTADASTVKLAVADGDVCDSPRPLEFLIHKRVISAKSLSQGIFVVLRR